ncbi:MAG: hypothetical protein O3B03_06570, partial [Proteobacteria bacterium]|nr:hypothetical protein [Pseudomonadota bacterium]
LAEILIVADDLTGALDAAGPFCERGFRVKTIVDATLPFAWCDLLEADVVALNTNSRHLSAKKATEAIEDSLGQLDLSDFKYVIKKIDSTLRGNVVSETLAVMDYCAMKEAYVAPAFPEQLRTVTAGQVYIDGVALSETEFVKDQLSPAPKINILKMFDVKDRNLLISLNVQSSPSNGGIGAIKVFDAINAEDLDRVVAGYLRTEIPCLLVGSSGVTSRLACALPRRHHFLATRGSYRSFLYLVGSRSKRSLEQVAELGKRYSGSVYSAINGKLDELPLPETLVCAIVAQQDSSSVEQPDVVAERLASTAVQNLHSLDPDVVLVTGGATALAFLRELNVSILDVCGNLMAGVPMSLISVGGQKRILLTKAGGFGSPRLFVDVAEVMA